MIISQALRTAKRPIRKLCFEAGQVYFTVTGSNSVECNICQFKARHLQSDIWHPNTICPRCRSQVRQRLLWACLTLLPETNLQKLVENKTVLHFAPERVLGGLLRQSAGEYKTADFLTDGYGYGELDYQIDISDMTDIRGEEFDCVVACDVLEHVCDHIRAIREVHRILRPGGYCIFTVPQKDNLETTFEDPSITDPIDRERVFGQRDHLRIYGNDFPAILADTGFEVLAVDETRFSDDIVRRFVLFPPVLSSHPLATNHRKIFFGKKRGLGFYLCEPLCFDGNPNTEIRNQPAHKTVIPWVKPIGRIGSHKP